MTRKRKTKKLILTLLTLLLLIATAIIGRGAVPAFADTSSNENVLTDLQTDASFDATAYPDKPKDYSLKVIQIAESVNGELFIYTYQPCQKTRYLIATEINISLTDKIGGEINGDETLFPVDSPKLYGLELINSNGVFCKYKVKNFTVSKDFVRYYNITSIYRDWIKELDWESGNDNEKLSKYFKVGKLYTAVTINGSVQYSCKNVDVIEIKNPYVDFLSYGEQSGWDIIFNATKWTDIHYIAFSTDKKIDELKEADVTYTTQTYHYTSLNGEGYTYGEKSDAQYKTLKGEKIGVTGSDKYQWKSILRSKEFIETAELNDAAKEEVEKSEFVLVFHKTPFKEQEKWSFMQGHYKEADGIKVSDVAILRLKFETDGICYNLGALMDKQEGDNTAGNKPGNNAGGKGLFEEIIDAIVAFFKSIGNFLIGVFGSLKWWQWLLIGLAGLFLIGLIIAILIYGVKAVFKGIWWLIKKLIQGIWWFVGLPFRGIRALIDRGKKNGK